MTPMLRFYANATDGRLSEMVRQQRHIGNLLRPNYRENANGYDRSGRRKYTEPPMSK